MKNRQRTRLLVWGAFLACAVILIGFGLHSSKNSSAAATGTTSPTATTTTSGQAASTQTTSPSGTSTSAPATTVPRLDPGRLPQTRTEPAFGAPLDARMRTLWGAIVADSPGQGRQVFFPESAYLKMKTGTIANPAGDYRWRLLAFFDLDLAAYHAHLGPDPAAAKLVAVNANPALAAWIPAGACENTVGYWHLPGTRLVYTSAGRTYSVRVASLISWRGVWYVVHLGPNPRPTNVGTVDDPRLGPGTPGPGGGC